MGQPGAREQEFLVAAGRDLEAVEAALAKLEEGTYGLCEACGQPIENERLSAGPTERFCAAHGRGPANEDGAVPALPPTPR